MAYENCPQCGFHKHQLISCPQCGFHRMSDRASFSRIPSEGSKKVVPRIHKAPSPASSSNYEACPHCGTRKHLVMACPGCGFSRSSYTPRKFQQSERTLREDTPSHRAAEPNKAIPTQSPVVRWKRSRVPSKADQ